MRIPRILMAISVIAVTSAFSLAQSTSSPQGEPENRRFGVVGASISAGMGSRFRMAEALQIVTRPELNITDAANLMTFMNPQGSGEAAVQLMNANKPTDIVAIDFLFWNVYGARMKGFAERKAGLDKGLAQLDRMKGRLFVGDIPMINDASISMLPPSAVPEQGVLDRLNQALKTWAEARKDRVVLMPVGHWLDALKNGKSIKVLGKAERFKRSEILARDNLHLSRKGVLVAATLTSEILAKHGALAQSELMPDFKTVFAQSDTGQTTLSVVVLMPDGSVAPDGIIAFEFSIVGLTFQEMLSLAPIAELRDDVPISKVGNPYRIVGIPDAALKLPPPQVQARYDGLISTKETFEFKKGKETKITLRLSSWVTKGRLVAKDGAPLAQIEVLSLTELQARGMKKSDVSPDLSFVARTNAKGEFRLHGIRPGVHTIVWRKNPVSPWTDAGTVAAHRVIPATTLVIR